MVLLLLPGGGRTTDRCCSPSMVTAAAIFTIRRLAMDLRVDDPDAPPPAYYLENMIELVP